jgi:hypothetical protein
MSDDRARIKWHPLDENAARALTAITNSPGVVYPIGTNALPQPLQGMPGVCSYYASGYATGQVLPQGLTLGGEMLVARTDGVLTKNDQFVFATSSNGGVCFAGPFKGYGHHVSSGQQVDVSSMFNQTPFSSKA